MTGFIVELALRARNDTKSDHVDGKEPGDESAAKNKEEDGS
jgi:hypothetical protein